MYKNIFALKFSKMEILINARGYRPMISSHLIKMNSILYFLALFSLRNANNCEEEKRTRLL